MLIEKIPRSPAPNVAAASVTTRPPMEAPRRRHEAIALIVLGLLLSAACGVGIAFRPTNTPPHPMVPRAPETVEIHRLAPNDRPFVEVGTLDETGFWGGGTEHADELLREQAADLGCDALVIQGYIQRGARYRAICIVYKN